jgi:hypothetical protein
MNRVFIGYEPKQPLAYTVLQHSIIRHASVPVAITPLMLKQLPLKRRGLTEFTYSRYLVPWLCGFQGTAVFMDADIVVTGDIKELFDQVDPGKSVQVMQNQAQFEWASVMLFNNEKCAKLTPEFVEDPANRLFDMAWAEGVGTFTEDWNHCVGYMPPKEAKLYHFTQGLPCWHETAGLAEDAAWKQEYEMATATVAWADLMLNSVHAKAVLRRMMSKYTERPAVA